MSVRWFPCRWCGHLTSGVDSYVVCSDCIRDFELRVAGRQSPYEDVVRAPLTPEVETSLRKLLDW